AAAESADTAAAAAESAAVTAHSAAAAAQSADTATDSASAAAPSAAAAAAAEAARSAAAAREARPRGARDQAPERHHARGHAAHGRREDRVVRDEARDRGRLPRLREGGEDEEVRPPRRREGVLAHPVRGRSDRPRGAPPLR